MTARKLVIEWSIDAAPVRSCEIGHKPLYLVIEFRPNELASRAKAALLTTFSKTRE